MHLLKVSSLLLLLCLGCDEKTKREFFPSAAGRVIQITYTQDARTGLCFAVNSVTNSNGFSDDVFTNVPCTPEVEKLLLK
jgi:hypothetical protein